MNRARYIASFRFIYLVFARGRPKKGNQLKLMTKQIKKRIFLLFLLNHENHHHHHYHQRTNLKVQTGNSNKIKLKKRNNSIGKKYSHKTTENLWFWVIFGLSKFHFISPAQHSIELWKSADYYGHWIEPVNPIQKRRTEPDWWMDDGQIKGNDPWLFRIDI